LRLDGQRGRFRRPQAGSRGLEPILTDLPGAMPPAREDAPDRNALQATYEDLGYRDVFWAARRYEDGCDRLAIRALLPPVGDRLIEVGAGFGRLATEYDGFRSIVLLDSSEVHVAAARAALAADARIEFVLGDACALPYPDGSFDAAVCVRVLHHFADPEPVLAELGRILRPDGVLVLEYANKRNLKSIARRVLRRQAWSPFDPGSVQYRPFHFDHAPVSVRRALRRAGLRVERVRAASLFRVGSLTRRLSPRLLLAAEARLQGPLGEVTPGPSVFLRARRIGPAGSGEPRAAATRRR
jgi:SAM-dependent methyltransferase